MSPRDCLSEDEILRFAGGRLAPAARTALEAHVRACADCEQLVGAVLAGSQPVSVGERSPWPPTPDLTRGALVGRYTVLSLVGRGAMAEVYAAYDPELDRKVAVKLLSAHSNATDPRAEIRLLREARAVARLSHPNVIAVYDAGRFDDRIFLAMEYVDGQTLAAWLRERPRTREDILKMFGGAARGLAAVHACGLVHRDFKPANVMVTSDGIARVTDFGLAQRLYTTPDRESDATGQVVGARSLDLTLTRPGELVGTPLYMSPEQLTGEQTDTRSDQFSFCVALHLALYDEHPFLANSETDIERLIENVSAGRIRPPRHSPAVPPWLRGALVRGLATSPEERWPSMADLAAALEQDPIRTRRRRALMTTGALAVVALAILVGRTTHPRVALCEAGPSKLADVWPMPGAPGAVSSRAATLTAAFAQTGVPRASETAARVARVLDRYGETWLAAYRDACEATHVRGEQSSEVLDLRMQCLEERRGALSALTAALAAPDTSSVRNGLDAANALPDLTHCSDAAGLRAVAPPPPVGNVRARVDDLRRRAAKAKVAHDTGRHSESIQEGRALVQEARVLGYEPLVAELLEMLGAFQINAEFAPDTLAILEEATWTALRVRRDDIAARCAALLTAYTGDYANRPADAARWAALGGALLDRLGPGHERTRAWLLMGLALNQADDHLSRKYAEEAVVLAKRALPPDHPDIGFMLTTVAEEQHRLGDDSGALKTVEEARDVLCSAYGRRTLQVAPVLSNEGEYLVALGRPAEALPLFRESLTNWEDGVGPNGPFLAYPLTGLGRALLALGRSREARAALDRALSLREQGEPRPMELAETKFALARTLWAGGERRRARELALSARDDYARVRPMPSQANEVSAWIAGHHAGHGSQPTVLPAVTGSRAGLVQR